MQENPNEEKNFIIEEAGQQRLKLDRFIKALIQRCMGKALDYARMSGMADRSLKQFERTVKDDFYKIISDGSQILKDFGHIKDDETE